jgi:hypothetical protein
MINLVKGYLEDGKPYYAYVKIPPSKYIVRWSSFSGHKTLLILCADEKKGSITGQARASSKR